jgi:hypothetical protein
VLLSGCVGSGDEGVGASVGDDGVGGDAGVAGPAPGARPNWTHGDWFQFALAFDPGFGEPLFDSTDKLVVARADSSGYTLASGGRDLAVIDAEFDQFFVGKLNLDLEGAQGFSGLPFKMFEWPLEDGKSWSSPFPEFGEEGDETQSTIQLTAGLMESVLGPAGSAPGFHVHGVSAGGHSVMYTYSSAVGWFTQFEWTDPADRPIVSMMLQDYGANYTGTFTEVTLEPVYEKAAVMPYFVFEPEAAPSVDTVEIGDQFTFLLEVVVLFCFEAALQEGVPPAPAAGVAEVDVLSPSNTRETHQLVAMGCVDGFDLAFQFRDAYETGAWRYGYPHAGAGVGSFVMIHGFVETVTEFTSSSHDNH